jgi:pyridoxamine 5'-phosphate oxidase
MLRSLPTLTALTTQPLELDLGSAPDDPVQLFLEWLGTAVEHAVPEPHAMTLSTCDAHGPDARVLILKDLDDRGWWFASSSSSPKGRQLADFAHAALTFHWPQVGRQVRVRGPVILGGAEERAADFGDRSAGARAVALASKVSEPLESAVELDEAVRRAEAALDHDPELISPSWQLYAVVADRVEFWQADSQRRHRRLQYVRGDGESWTHQALWP